MPDVEPTQTIEESTGQESDNLKNQPKPTQTKTTDTPAGTSPDSPDSGQGTKIDFEKSYNEIQPQFTKVTQENVELQKRLTEAESKISSSKPPDTAIPKPDDSIQAKRQTLINEVQYLKEQGSSTVGHEVLLMQLDQMEKQQQFEQLQQRDNEDVTKFTSNEVFAKELKDGIYTDRELIAIKQDKLKSGQIIDYEIARAICITGNQAKYAQAIVDQKTKAQGATTQDGSTALPTETKEEGAAQKMVSGWGVKPA